MFRLLSQIIPPLGWPILLAALALNAVGLLGIYAGEADASGLPAKAARQAAFTAVGLTALIAVQILGYRTLTRTAYTLFGVVLVLLVLLVVARRVPLQPLIVPRREAYRWISLGPVNLQVSEFAKIAYVLVLAWHLRFRTNYRSLPGLVGLFVATLAPVILVLKEPDLGTSLVFFPVFFIMLFAAGARGRHIALLLLLGAVAAPLFYYSPLIKPYQKQRVIALMHQGNEDRQWRMGPGYQLHQSKIALGSGGWTGHGLTGSRFFQHQLLPEDENDFIFAVIGHQWGYLGAVGVLGLYFVIIAAGLTAASMTREPSGRLVAVGVCALFLTQAVINVGMTIGLTPVTGLSLPLVSMGGSGLIAHYLAIGLLISAARRQPLDVAPKAFEFLDEADQD